MVAIEGIDRAGKTTQTERLRAVLAAAGATVAVLSFPRYESFFGRSIRQLLDGHGAQSAATLDPRSMALWYALDRWSAMAVLDPTVDYLLANRYTLSNAVYQSSRVPPEQADELFRWVLELEHGQLRLPLPQLTVVLDVAPGVSKDRSHRRPSGGGREEAPDVYERSQSLLATARQRYLDAERLVDNVVVIDCARPPGPSQVDQVDQVDQGDQGEASLRSPDDVHELVLAALRAHRPS